MKQCACGASTETNRTVCRACRWQQQKARTTKCTEDAGDALEIAAHALADANTSCAGDSEFIRLRFELRRTAIRFARSVADEAQWTEDGQRVADTADEDAP